MSYIVQNPGVVRGLLLDHLAMTSVALAIALPISLLIARYRRVEPLALGALGVLYTTPSPALMILLLPIFGLNAKSVIDALVVYAQVILARNILAGLRAIDPAILEAARGMGMNAWQRGWQVQLPLALPVLIAGVRLAVVSIAIATVGAKFGAGGLGRLLFDSIQQTGRYDKIWAGGDRDGGAGFRRQRRVAGAGGMVDPIRRIGLIVRSKWRRFPLG